MSYGITAYAVDINQLKSVVGSNDDKLSAKLKNAYHDELIDLEEVFEEDIDEGEPSVGEVIDRIISGELEDIEPGNAQYGYALE